MGVTTLHQWSSKNPYQCALLGITQRKIRSKRLPDSGQKLRRKAFPQAAKTIGDLLRQRRIEKGLKLKELALLLGVASNDMTLWERDEAVPSADEWETLTGWLNLPSTISEFKPNS